MDSNKSNICYISLGTNIGNKDQHIKDALLKLNTIGSIQKTSSTWKSQSWGFQSDHFYNVSIKLTTHYSAHELLIQLQSIEKQLGRIKDPKINGYQARVIDIDILFFNNEIIKTKSLEIPHPRIQHRKFVLLPTLEITSDFTHPVLHKTLEELLAVCQDDSEISMVS